MKVAEALTVWCLVAMVFFAVSVTVVSIINNQEAGMEPEFTVRSYDLGNKPKPEAAIRYRVRLYEGGQVIKEWETEKHPYISDSGFVYVDGVRASGTILIEEVKP